MATAALPRTPARSFALGGLAWGLGLFALLRLPWVEARGVLPVTIIQGQLAAALSGATALPVDVTLACSGTDVLAMCLGAILAYPARWRMRIAGAAGGVAVVLALNVVRIATLGRAAASPALFDTLHLYVWPAALALCAAAYVFMWMRAAGEAATADVERRGVAAPTRAFTLIAGVLIVAFAAASPLYLESAWVLTVAGTIARAAAGVLQLAGMSALAAGNVLVTARGGVTVTQECISTPLIPVYLAAVLAYAPDWRRRAALLLAAVPIFFTLGVARLLVVAMPPALIDSPLFFIHAFYQLLTGAVIIAAAARWQHGAGRAWRPAVTGLVAGAVALAALMPVVSALVPARPFADPQGATTLLPAFQLALFAGLWLAAGTPARWTAFAMLFAALAIFNLVLFALLSATGGFELLAAHVPAVRAWAVVVPVALVAACGYRPQKSPIPLES